MTTRCWACSSWTSSSAHTATSLGDGLGSRSLDRSRLRQALAAQRGRARKRSDRRARRSVLGSRFRQLLGLAARRTPRFRQSAPTSRLGSVRRAGSCAVLVRDRGDGLCRRCRTHGARFRAEYELLLTQRLILQPEFEANLYGKRDPERGIASGLSDADSDCACATRSGAKSRRTSASSGNTASVMPISLQPHRQRNPVRRGSAHLVLGVITHVNCPLPAEEAGNAGPIGRRNHHRQHR